MRYLMLKLVLGLLLISNYVHAAELDACYQADFKQVDRMADLPPAVFELVYANSRAQRSFSALPKEEQIFIKSGQLKYDSIGDRGGPFSVGCGPTGNQTMARLVMAAISPACILVAIEHGGAAHGAGLRVFLRQGDTWVRGDEFEHPSATLMYQGKFETDLPTFIRQADYEFGDAFRYGRGVNKDLVESLKWYKQAASRGHARARFEVGNIYAEGRGVDKNLKTAISWFEKAAVSDPDWGYVLAKMYIEGKVVPQNIRIGLRKMHSAASRGSTSAQAYLGKLYVDGKYVKQDYVKAVKLFRKSINGDGRYYLSSMYRDGLGVEKNIVIAAALLNGPQYDYKNTFVLVSELTSEELQEAKQLKNDMDGYFLPQGRYVQPKGVLTALDLYLQRQ